jgi:putative transposase
MLSIQRAYKTELDPNKKQIEFFLKCSGVSRFVFNFYLECRQTLYKCGKQKVSAYSFDKELNKIKGADYPWMNEVPSSTVQIAEQQVDIAYKNMFNRLKKGEKPGFPKFKGRSTPRSFSFTTASVHIKDNSIKIPKIGWVRVKESSYLPTNLKLNRATVTEYGGRWFISVQCEDYIDETVPNSKKIVGVDVGIKNLSVCSDGRVFNNTRSLYRVERKMKRLQRSLSRKVKGSNNRKKARFQLAKLHYKVSCMRKHSIHEMTSAILRGNPAMVVVEDLAVKNMIKNHKLARALSDSALFEIKRQLTYKSDWKGVELVTAPRNYPSTQRCSKCGNIKEKEEKLTLADRIYECEKCGVKLDRDLNAALNLKQYGEAHRNLRLGRLEVTEEKSSVPIDEPRTEIYSEVVGL